MSGFFSSHSLSIFFLYFTAITYCANCTQDHIFIFLMQKKIIQL